MTKLLNNKKIYFASDSHFGVPDREQSLVRERLFIKWLDEVQQDAQEIYLMGDLFEFWFEYKTVVQKGHIRLLGKLAEITDKHIRLQAEFDNYRKRTLNEKIELMKSGGANLLEALLPMMDNFERALDAGSKTDDIKSVREGVDLIYNSFKEFFVKNGIKEMDSNGKEFDTDFHEALTKIPAPSEELKGKVVDVIEKGYLHHDKIMRFAKVVVGE